MAQIVEKEFGTAAQCTSQNFQGFPCTTTLVGGHVILGQVAQNVAAGSNSVFIMPICQKHNTNTPSTWPR